MPRGYLLYLEDILASTGKILKFAADNSLQSLLLDEMRFDAIVRNFEIIGEAAAKIPQGIKEKHPFIAWRKISGFRNVLAHEYFGIDHEIMWEIIKDRLPALHRDIQKILEEERKQ
ncbi:MAG: DUF86 domain-containing protein [Thermodesulfovibrionales bacterium]